MKTIEQRIISKMRGLILLLENYPIEFDMADKYRRETFYKEITKLEAQFFIKEQEDECCHPWSSVLGDGETQPAKCLKCGKIL